MMRDEPTTFADWYRTTHPGLAEMVVRAVSRRDVAEEATDEAFARAFANWKRVESMGSPSGWVYRVAVNAAKRQLARARTETEKLLLTPRPELSPPPGGETWLLVSELPLRQRTAVVLRHVAALTEVEVAHAMGVTRSTVSSTLASAYLTLGRQLAEPTTERKQMTEGLRLAVAAKCGPDGCDVEELGTAHTRAARYSDAVRNTIKIRPGDLVALDATTNPPQVVWRWWSGTVEAVDDERATVSRNVTQREPGDDRRGSTDVDLPDEFRGSLSTGDRVWFGDEDGRKVVVAVASPELRERVSDRLPDIKAALDAPAS